MPRRFQIGSGGIVFHVMNRGARRARIFFDADDYRCFLRAMSAALAEVEMRILAYAVMPNHWHLVLWPEGDQDLSLFMQHMTRMHAQWWHLAHGSVGTGAVYQGRFRAIPVQNDDHFLTVCRYVERNPARAFLVERARDWQWSSAWSGEARDGRPCLSPWPVPRPRDWLDRLDGEGVEPTDELREAIQRSVPYGTREWTDRVASRLRLSGKLAGRGRPPKGGDANPHVAETEIRPDRISRGSSAGGCAG